ncbi:hypothetical protein [Paenibacillus solani]|uniref:hypothetical protein n=1 Tax=Paenibacillus solani TaxID=1705565 RepID=UPI003D2B446A
MAFELTDKLYYQNLTFYYAKKNDEGDRIYQTKDELHRQTIVTAPADYDGALIGMIDESLRESDDDDLIRYFDSITGMEEI